MCPCVTVNKTCARARARARALAGACQNRVIISYIFVYFRKAAKNVIFNYYVLSI